MEGRILQFNPGPLRLVPAGVRDVWQAAPPEQRYLVAALVGSDGVTVQVAVHKVGCNRAPVNGAVRPSDARTWFVDEATAGELVEAVFFYTDPSALDKIVWGFHCSGCGGLGIRGGWRKN